MKIRMITDYNAEVTGVKVVSNGKVYNTVFEEKEEQFTFDILGRPAKAVTFSGVIVMGVKQKDMDNVLASIESVLASGTGDDTSATATITFEKKTHTGSGSERYQKAA